MSVARWSSRCWQLMHAPHCPPSPSSASRCPYTLRVLLGKPFAPCLRGSWAQDSEASQRQLPSCPLCFHNNTPDSLLNELLVWLDMTPHGPTIILRLCWLLPPSALLASFWGQECHTPNSSMMMAESYSHIFSLILLLYNFVLCPCVLVGMLVREARVGTVCLAFPWLLMRGYLSCAMLATLLLFLSIWRICSHSFSHFSFELFLFFIDW